MFWMEALPAVAFMLGILRIPESPRFLIFRGKREQAREIFARGVRNSVGMAWHPDTKELWFTDNGRDDLGDDVPPDELNTARVLGHAFTSHRVRQQVEKAQPAL